MREKILYTLGVIAAVILVRNVISMLVNLPDEQFQGAIFRIIFFHVPAAWTAFLGFFGALIAAVVYLTKRNMAWDDFALSAIECGLAFGAINLVTGMIWGRIIWGIWWTWDWRLTSMLVCWLLYAGYLVLRRAIDEPSQRANMASVLSILNFAVVPFVVFSIKWFRTQHPQPVLWGGGSMDSSYRVMLYGNLVPLLIIAAIFISIRMRQARTQREIDALRRTIHAF